MLEFPGCESWFRATSESSQETGGDLITTAWAELWFDDLESLLTARQSPEWKASTDDEANFIDHSKVAYFVSEEHVIVDELN